MDLTGTHSSQTWTMTMERDIGEYGLLASQNDLGTKQDALNAAQMKALNDATDELYTIVYVENETTPYKFVSATSTITLADFTDAGLYGTNSWKKKPTDIRFGTNVVTLNQRTFRALTTLTWVEGPNVEGIGSSTFQGCTKLAHVSFPKLKTLGSNAFSTCSLLTSITLPPSITSISSTSFFGSSAIATFQEKTLTEVQSMSGYPFGFQAANIRADKTATQNWVEGKNYATQTYAVKNDGGVAKVKSISQADYDALVSPDATTLYVIPEEV